jgi:hypothetical protein
MAGALEEVARLRRRAAAVRAVAVALDRSIVHDLARLSGSPTWVGPSASAFDEIVRAAERATDEARSAVLAVARRLDERADEVLADETARAGLGAGG